MRINIEIIEDELELKKAIAKGWNKRFDDNLTYKDISDVSNKDDILSAIPYLDNDVIEITSVEQE
jgi:hypothetical protein